MTDEIDVSELAEACDEYRAAYWAREDRTPDVVDNLAAPIAQLRAVLALTERQPGRGGTLIADTAIDCRSEVGVTVGLVDSLISISRVLARRDLTEPAVVEALADLRDDEDLHAILHPAEDGEG